jgi:hypothetical protein
MRAAATLGNGPPGTRILSAVSTLSPQIRPVDDSALNIGLSRTYREDLHLNLESQISVSERFHTRLCFWNVHAIAQLCPR